MPTIAELLKADGVVLTSEQEAKLPTLFEASDEARGIVTTKNDLLKWKQDNTDKVTGYDDIQIQYTEELEAKKALALKNKDLEAYLLIETEQNKAKDAKIKSKIESEVVAKTKSLTLEVSAMFGGGELGLLIAKNFVSVSAGEDGEVKEQLNLNGIVFDNTGAFKEAAAKVEHLAKQMTAPQSSGPSGNGNGTGGGKAPKDMNEAERLELKRTDPHAFNQAFKR
jgi:hypothetical protein